jgi:PAS domain S-box-containing protein
VFDAVTPPGVVNGAPGQDALMSIHAYTQPVAVGDRIWEVELRGSTGAYTTRFEKSLPLMLMTAGVLSSVLLFGVLYALATSRKRAIQLAQEITKDLRESRAGLADAQAMAQLGSWTFEPATGAMTWSAEMYRIFGLTPRSGRETYADALSSIHELDRAKVDAALHDLVETKKGGYNEYRICGPDGEIRWVHIIANLGNHDTPGLVRGTIRDITERKLAGFALKKSQLELQSLSRRLVDLVEVERKRFSTELHDVVGQNITALGLSLQILKTQLASSETNLMRERIDDSLGLVRSTADAVENVLSELRPPMLDDYGLLAALEWYAEKFSTRTGVETIVCGDESGRRMDGQVEIALFRIAQEALNNVAKHSGAKLAEVKIARSATHYLMSVSDDGNGFDVQVLTLARRNRGSSVAPVKERRRERLGMVTMRERARAIGATFNVTSAPNRGTQVEIRIALP